MDQSATRKLSWRRALACIGPGVLLAGAAIGVSHLIQSTRAGAGFGFGMLGLLVLACVTKYPFLEFGPRYAAATGEDLIEGYRKLGAWAVWLAAALTFASMFIIMAAVTLVTAAIAKHVFGAAVPGMDAISLNAWAGIVIGLCLAVLLVGRYRVLERTMKIVMLLLLVSTVAAVVVAAIAGSNPVSIPDTSNAIDQTSWWSAANFAFVLAFMGWMPIPVDSAIWNSIWVREHGRACGQDMTRREAIFDFRVGYIGAGLVAVLFLTLGALVMHERVGELKDGAGFVNQLIDVYGQTLGGWSVPLISAAALTTMFSTTLVVLDAFPRAMHRLTQAMRSVDPDESNGRRSYIGWVLAQAGVAVAILLFFRGGMKAMVDIATTLSFLTAPLLAMINYLVITRHVPAESRPGKAMRVVSIGSMVFLFAFSAAYIAWRITG